LWWVFFSFFFFIDGVWRTICLGWPGTAILLTSASWVGRIIGVSHWPTVIFNFLVHSAVLLNMFSMLCNHHHHPSAELSIFPNWSAALTPHPLPGP
jgi:hypothetical protein